jgi:hypothetical protein
MATSSSPQTPRLVPTGLKFRQEPQLLHPFSILAFDPGGTTGITCLNFEGGMSDTINLHDFKMSYSSLGPSEHHLELLDCLKDFAELCERLGIAPHIVTEAFTFRQFATDESYGRPKVELISCEYIGIIKAVAASYDISIKSYMSSEGKGFVTDAKLEKMGWLQKPKTANRHINDATRQLVCYLVKELRIYAPITTSWRD